jgi:Flp pilus assembly protein TadG
MIFNRTRHHDCISKRRAMVAVLAGLMLPVIVGLMALSLDGGLMYLQRRQAQSTADAAALAGAYALYNSSNFSTAQSAAVAIALQNGITITDSQITQPKTGYVAVAVTTSQPKTFSALWGSGTNTSTASAVARSTNVPYSTASLLLLDPSGTLALSGTASIKAVGGSIVMDSTSAAAIAMSGSASITAPTIDLSAGSSSVHLSGSAAINAPSKNYNQPSTADPLANIPALSSSNAPGYPNVNSAVSLSSSATKTISPGIYNGFTLSGSSSLTLNPGVYYMNSGGISMSGSSSISGDGVFIYNSSSSGAINLSGSGSIALSPMAGGTYAGITVFQDRSNTSSATMSGSGTVNNSGTFYFPSASLTMSGSSATNIMGSQFIVKDLTFSGSASLNVTYGSSVASSSSLGIVQ